MENVPSSDENGEPPRRRRRGRYFYGWNIVVASFMAHLAYAEQFSSTLGLFFQPLKGEFGWGYTQIAAVQTISRFVEAGTAPLIGPVGGSIWGTYPVARGRSHRRYGPGGSDVRRFPLAVLSGAWIRRRHRFHPHGFSLVTSVAINNWFIRMRGRALAISNTGASISNVVMIPVAVYVIAEFGWREMFWIFAILTWIVVLAPSTILIRRRPEDYGPAAGRRRRRYGQLLPSIGERDSQATLYRSRCIITGRNRCGNPCGHAGKP